MSRLLIACLLLTDIPYTPPVDVPAKSYVVHEVRNYINISPPEPNERDVEHWTCDDKRRVLLTSEDGKHHCILFGEGK